MLSKVLYAIIGRTKVTVLEEGRKNPDNFNELLLKTNTLMESTFKPQRCVNWRPRLAREREDIRISLFKAQELQSNEPQVKLEKSRLTAGVEEEDIAAKKKSTQMTAAV